LIGEALHDELEHLEDDLMVSFVEAGREIYKVTLDTPVYILNDLE
jgi:hypothetical protein